VAIQAIVFDLDDTLIIEEATARASLRTAAALLPGVDAHHVEEAVLAHARRIWRAGSHHRVCAQIGVASWEALWSDFAGCHPILDPIRDWSIAYRQQAWMAALAELGVNGDPALAAAMSDAYVYAQRSGHPVVEGATEIVRTLHH
jgi:FMN phosphatase YigB (HAD superfamily)